MLDLLSASSEFSSEEEEDVMDEDAALEDDDVLDEDEDVSPCFAPKSPLEIISVASRALTHVFSLAAFSMPARSSFRVSAPFSQSWKGKKPIRPPFSTIWQCISLTTRVMKSRMSMGLRSFAMDL